jgi:membrane fusion protein, adhesin transport system
MKHLPTSRGFAAPSMTVLLMVGLALFMAWAAWFDIDATVRAQGQVIPGGRTQIIQSADGGVLSKILVQEGQSVTSGQLLAVLERDRSSASFEASRDKAIAISAALERAQAEASGRTPNFGAKTKAFGVAQQALYVQRKRSLQEELDTLNDGMATTQEELRMNENLLKTGDISRIEVMRAQRQVSELQGRINAARNKYLQEARQEAAKQAEELSAIVHQLEERQSVLGHTELSSPVDGVVKQLKINTVGGVLRAGDELMQISPTQGEQVIEVKINPADIGQLKLGLPVTIKLDAFDYSSYGTLQGSLSHISSDTLTEQGSAGQANTFYRAQVRFNVTNTNAKLASVAIKPGMTATVDVRTSSRSILEYLAKPVYKAFGGAMNER